MKSISVKLPTLAKLAEVFGEVTVCAALKGTIISFGNESQIDFKDIGKTVSLEFSPEDDWTWCAGESSYTGIDTDDLHILFPKRKFKVPRRSVTVGCNSVRISEDLDIIAGSHKLTEKEITGVEELLASRREMKKT